VTFVSVMFLLGVLGVVGPIVVHLLARPKFKRLPFTMLQFLREGQSESQARRRLRDWIILLLRCAIVALLALLFARPIWETHLPRAASQGVWLVGLDNSLSMTYRGEGGTLLAQLKSQAKDVIRACPDESEFHVFLAGDKQWFRHINQAQALALVHDMKPAESPAQFENFLSVVRSQSQTLDDKTQLNVLLGSDFSRDVMLGLRGLITPVGVDSLKVLSIIPDRELINAGIVSGSVSSVEKHEAQVHVTLRNTSTPTITRTLRAPSLEPQEVTLLPHSHQVFALTCPLPKTVKNQQHRLTISLAGKDDFEADDEIQLNVMVPDQTLRHVLLVDQKNTDRLFLFKTAIESLADRVLGMTWETRCVTVAQMTELDLAWADTVVLAGVTDALNKWAEPLNRFVRQKKRLVCFNTDWPERKTASKVAQSTHWPVTLIERTAHSTQPESQPMESQWTHAGAGESLTQYELGRMSLRSTARVRLVSDATCIWRLQNGEPFVVIRPLGQGVILWVNTSVDASLSALAKSPAAVAWAQFLLESGQGSGQQDRHELWRECEPILEPASLTQIEQVTHRLFEKTRSSSAEMVATSQMTKQSPLWRQTAWLLLILMLIEPFVAERMKP
jgi:hypothetical protein